MSVLYILLTASMHGVHHFHFLQAAMPKTKLFTTHETQEATHAHADTHPRPHCKCTRMRRVQTTDSQLLTSCSSAQALSLGRPAHGNTARQHAAGFPAPAQMQNTCPRVRRCCSPAHSTPALARRSCRPNQACSTAIMLCHVAAPCTTYIHCAASLRSLGGTRRPPCWMHSFSFEEQRVKLYTYPLTSSSFTSFNDFLYAA